MTHLWFCVYLRKASVSLILKLFIIILFPNKLLVYVGCGGQWRLWCFLWWFSCYMWDCVLRLGQLFHGWRQWFRYWGILSHYVLHLDLYGEHKPEERITRSNIVLDLSAGSNNNINMWVYMYSTCSCKHKDNVK